MSRKSRFLVLFLFVVAALRVCVSAQTPTQHANVAAAATNVLTDADILKMVKAKLGDDIILDKIKSSPSNFDMSIDSVLKLKAAGASDAVVRAMASASGKSAIKEISPSNPDLSGFVNVEMKTPVRLLVDESLTSKTANSGQTVPLVAAEDVLVNSKVVIAKGSPASGRITVVEKRGMNHPGKLEVTVDSVRAVDGHNIPLEGQIGMTGTTRWGTGKDVQIKKGDAVNCVVAKDTEVKF
jgi:hypothetical protein